MICRDCGSGENLGIGFTEPAFLIPDSHSFPFPLSPASLGDRGIQQVFPECQMVPGAASLSTGPFQWEGLPHPPHWTISTLAHPVPRQPPSCLPS